MVIGNNFLFHHFVNEPWALKKDVLELMKSTLFQKMSGEMLRVNDSTQGESNFVERYGGIAVLNIEGVLVPKASYLNTLCGLTPTRTLHSIFNALVSNPSITRIVLNIDSPGGASSGIKEFSEDIFNARDKKEIVAYVDNMACSAGYWLASSCEQIVCTKTSSIGSIGTYIMVQKELKDKATSETFIFFEGKKKLYGSSEMEITDDEISYFTERVRNVNSGFLEAVARNRNVSVEEVSKLEAEHFYAENAPSWMYSEIGNVQLVMS